MSVISYSNGTTIVSSEESRALRIAALYGHLWGGRGLVNDSALTRSNRHAPPGPLARRRHISSHSPAMGEFRFPSRHTPPGRLGHLTGSVAQTASGDVFCNLGQYGSGTTFLKTRNKLRVYVETHLTPRKESIACLQ
jgi:hypothetical protein